MFVPLSRPFLWRLDVSTSEMAAVMALTSEEPVSRYRTTSEPHQNHVRSVSRLLVQISSDVLINTGTAFYPHTNHLIQGQQSLGGGVQPCFLSYQTLPEVPRYPPGRTGSQTGSRAGETGLTPELNRTIVVAMSYQVK